MGFSGNLEKMKVVAYQKSDFTGWVGEFFVYINPEKYTQSYEICYNDTQAQGSNTGTPDFNKIPSDKLDFELIFDGTGVVPSPIPGVLPFDGDGISEQIDEFLGLIFHYNGKIHSPH